MLPISLFFFPSGRPKEAAARTFLLPFNYARLIPLYFFLLFVGLSGRSHSHFGAFDKNACAI